uniref:hypothetical protein n=1 Tax=Scytothamnus australis TaxID=66621 RepID=UPI002E75CBC6|nr:hypothetical protein V2495_pgp042 [Scytothamnus australis]WAM64767.1 hypothetical protein [Scytothamnus australis]
MKTFQEELVVLLKARYPIIYIVTIEEERLEYSIRNTILNKRFSNLYIWDFIEGFNLNPMKKDCGKRNPLGALEFVETMNSNTPSIFILKDFRRFLTDLTISRKLRNLLPLLKREPKTIIIIDSEIQIPNDLKDSITILKFNLPSPKEIRAEILRLSQKLTLKGKISQKTVENIIKACQGLSLEKIRRVLGKAIVIYRQLDHNSIPIILGEKRQVISQTKLLEFWAVKKRLKDIGGAYNLKRWLTARNDVFSEKALQYNLPIPKGVLIAGMQGCGKSLIAKAIAFEWRLPLLRLDIGRLFGGVVGESELRVREMIDIAESLSPCILWIDELDKSFIDRNYDSDSGTTSRVLATLLTWLGEKTLPVFVVATANDIKSLPTEILRKGRFDEVFFLKSPDLNEREVIFEIHLQKFRPESWEIYDIKRLSRKSTRFSGAEIEQTIIDAMYVAFSQDRDFTTGDILLAIKETVPLIDIAPLRASKINSWARSGRVRFA